MKMSISVKYDPNIVVHYTSSKVEPIIRASGFKTGQELGVGETTGAVYASQINTGVNYNRHGGKTVPIRINIQNIKCLELNSLPSDESKPSFEQPAYTVRQNVERGIFPKGYDAIISRRADGKIHEIAIKPGIATKYMVAK